MVREEEMLQAAADTFKVCGGEFDKAVKMLWITAFITGLDYADRHPKNVWHDASEEPEGNNWRILFQAEEGDCWVENRGDMVYSHNTWKEFVEDEMIVKWAYISDILPKGGAV